MQPSDLEHLAVPGDPQLHPDGLRTAYVLTEIDVGEDRYVRTIHLHDRAGTRRFTHGPSDTAPRWSPDGRWLAFLRTGTGEGQHPQVHVMPADGGEAQRRTELPLGVSDLAWAPDSTQLVVVAAVWHPEVADLDEEERRRRPRRLTRLPYRTDGGGWIHDRTARLHLVPATGDRRAVELDTGPRDVSSPVWHPDGTSIAYLSDPDDWPQTEPHSQVFALSVPPRSSVTSPADGADAEQLSTTPSATPFADGASEPRPAVQVARVPLTPPGMWTDVRYDRQGRVFVTGLRDPFDWPGTPAIWLLARDPGTDGGDAGGGDAGGGEAGAAVSSRPQDPAGARLIPLTAHLDRDVQPGSPGLVTIGPRFVHDGFLTALEGRGTTGIVHVHLAGFDPEDDQPPEVTEVVGGPRAVTGFGVSDDAEVVVFTATDPGSPGELYRSTEGRERCVTDLTHRFRAQVEVGPTERFTFERDGVELDVWATLPDGFDAAAPGSVPVLFNIHGGPTAQYGEHFFDEFQVEAGAGYLAVGTNPRGSSGRGTEWARAVVGAWVEEDSVDTLDLEAVVAATCARYPQADPARVGIMGGSYGGYATARLLARTDRYRSAIVERGLLQWESFIGTSDIGPYFDRMFLAVSLLEGRAAYAAASPVWTTSRITTPTLVLHSDADWRCPPEQGEQFFSGLLHAGVAAEMVRFPDEGHELSRSGTPKHRVERFEAVLEWHERYLGAAPTGATSAAGTDTDAGTGEPSGPARVTATSTRAPGG
ncbi:MAG: S9 family peptidase [Nitriliruptoraceae bacterium]